MEKKCLSLVLGVSLLAACAMPAPPPPQGEGTAVKPEPAAPEAKANTQAPTAAEAEPTLGITVDRYVERLREIAADTDTLKVGDIVATSTDASTSIQLANGAAVVLSVDSDSGNVDSLTFTGDPAKNSDAFALITLAGVAVHAAFPASEGAQIKAGLAEAFTGLEAGGKTREVRIGDRVVFASMAVGLGLVVGVEPADA